MVIDLVAGDGALYDRRRFTNSVIFSSLAFLKCIAFLRLGY